MWCPLHHYPAIREILSKKFFIDILGKLFLYSTENDIINKIHRKYENDDERFFEIIKPAIRKYKGNIYGAGIKLY